MTSPVNPTSKDGAQVFASDGALHVKVVSGGGASAGGVPVTDAAGVRWLWIYNADAGSSTYVNLSTGSTGTPTMPVTPDADTSVQVSNFPAQWEDGAYTMNSTGQLISETQISNTGATRTRSWSYSTDASGNVTATPGAWV